LLVRAPGRVAAGQVRDQPVSFTAFVHTAASLLGLPAPAGAGAGEDLTTTRPAR
jgi:arylsulfatase A-like enzyme